MKEPRVPLKYDYSALAEQIALLARSKDSVSLADLRTFYPRASWAELRYAVHSAGISYNEKTYEIKVGQ